MKTKIIAMMLVVLLVFGVTYYSFAESLEGLKEEQNEINKRYEEVEAAHDEAQSNLSDALKEVQSLSSQISEYENTISNLNAKISDISNNITKAENDIVKKQKETDERQDLLNKRLIAIYESGNTSYLDMLLASNDLSDFLSKYYLISEIAEYDTNLIISLKEAKKQLEEDKASLESDKKALENTKQEQVEKQEALKKIKAEKDAKYSKLASDEKALSNELDEIEAEKREIDYRVDNWKPPVRPSSSNSGGSSSGDTTGAGSSGTGKTGFIFPIPGLSKSNINNPNYPSYYGHNGVDINIGVRGKSVVAVADGEVIESTALRNSRGNYISYGEYIVIGHYDGTRTYYCHLAEGSRAVSEGETVTQGQYIGMVGSTGNSTGPHLHFGVRVNGSFVNPIPYLP